MTMNKKEYKKPAIEVVEIETEAILAASGLQNELNGDFEIGGNMMRSPGKCGGVDLWQEDPEE